MASWLDNNIPGASLNRLSAVKKASKADRPEDQENEKSTTASSTIMSESAPHWAEFFEPDPWGDDLKPPLKFMDLEGSVWDEEEVEGILSDHMIEAGLSFPAPSPLLYHYSMSKLRLSGKNLFNIYKIADYKYLQYIDLSRNNLHDLTPVGNLPFLMYLDVSYNNLTYVLPFAAPLKLTYVNYSNNKVNFIDDLTDFWSLIKLDLSHNNISTIEGLQNLRYLRVLDLSFNNIKRFENLTHLRLTHLYLQNNQISEFEEGDEYGMKTILSLQYINLDNNKLRSLVLFEESYSLVNVSIIGNQISEIFEMENLKSSVTLKELNLLGNPMVEWPEYRGMVISTVPSLRVLDGIPVGSNEKVSAKNTFDPDIRIVAARNHDLLLIMEQLNNAVIEPCIFPVDQQPLPIVILVGPVASMKGNLVRYVAERFPNKVSLAVWHTSRPQSEDEIDGYHYHFVTKDKINEMAHSGVFVAYTQILGETFGLDRAELIKAHEKKCLCISHMDLVGAESIYNRGLHPHVIFTISQSEELHLQRLLKKHYVAFRCSQEQCQRKQLHREEEKTADQPRTTIHFIESLFTDSFLKKIAKDQTPEANIHMDKNEELSYIPRNTINNIASLFTEEILGAVVEFQERKARSVPMNEELDPTLYQRTHEYIESLITDSVLKQLAEKQTFEDIEDEYARGGNTIQYIHSMIEEQLWKRVTGKKKGQMEEEEENKTTEYIKKLIQDSLSKHITEIQKNKMKNEEVDEIENMIRDTLLKRLTKSLRSTCHCISEENMEEEEERKLSQETYKYIRSLVADHVTKHIADEKITNLPRETIKYVESLVTEQLAKHITQDQKAEGSIDGSPEEVMAKIKRSTAEYIAIGALFTDSFLIATEEDQKPDYLSTEEEVKITNLPRETIKYIESLLTDRSLKQMEKQQKLKCQIRKKITCQECDFAMLCVRLVLESRQIYFKLCEQNKDFFSSVIYTDDINEAFHLLSNIIKEVYRSMSLMPPIFSEEHERFKSSLSNKLNLYMSEIDKHHHIYEEEKSPNQDCQKLSY